MGYRGQIDKRNQARDLRAQGWTMVEIAEALGVSKSTVSNWTADVEFDDQAWRARLAARRVASNGTRRRSSLSLRREQQEAAARREGIDLIGEPSDRELLCAGLLLYAGEGFKTKGAVGMANTDPRILRFFVSWLRRFFEVDEARLRVRLYLHEGLDLEVAEAFWSDLLKIPRSQFRAPYRAVADPTRRRSKHPMGCPNVRYCCTQTHRRVLAMIDALICCKALPG